METVLSRYLDFDAPPVGPSEEPVEDPMENPTEDPVEVPVTDSDEGSVDDSNDENEPMPTALTPAPGVNPTMAPVMVTSGTSMFISWITLMIPSLVFFIGL